MLVYQRLNFLLKSTIFSRDLRHVCPGGLRRRGRAAHQAGERHTAVAAGAADAFGLVVGELPSVDLLHSHGLDPPFYSWVNQQKID